MSIRTEHRVLRYLVNLFSMCILKVLLDNINFFFLNLYFLGMLLSLFIFSCVFFYFILFLSFTILYWFFPNIEMNPPQVYMCSPFWTLLPPHTIPLGRPSAPAPSIRYCALNLDWWLISYMILYMFQCHSPKSSHPLPLPPSP